MRESELTRPGPHCPRPDYWHAHDGMATEVEVLELVGAFVRALQPEIVIETGTHRGFGAEAIGRALQQNGHGWLWTLEVDGDVVEQAYRRVRGLPVTLLVQPSLDFKPPGAIDFAWFDSDPDIRAMEYLAYRPWMHARTVVGFHDTAPHHGIRGHLDELDLELLDLPTPRGVTFGRIRKGATWQP